jgi:serine protease Do
VSTAIFSPNGGNVGIAFAIPANQAKSVIAEIKENGSVERGWLGVQIQDLDAELAASLGLAHEKGALVAEVLGDGPAQAAGVKAGDVITRFGNHEVDSARSLSRLVGDANPADTANLTVWRDGKSQQVRVKLGEAARGEQVAAAAVPGVDGETTLGLTLRALTDEDKAQLGIAGDTQGVLVANVEPNSPAAEKGIRAGDVITRVNQRQVGSVDDALDALADARDQDRALLLVKRGDGQRFVALSFS